MRWASVLAVAAVALWSAEIGAELAWPPPDVPAAASASPARGTAAAKVDAVPRHALPLDPFATIDKRVFLAALQRQAEPLLLPCLQGWQGPPHQVAVTATLDKSGHLLHVSSLDPTRPLPECAVAALQAMLFPAVAASLQRPAVSLQWRLDW